MSLPAPPDQDIVVVGATGDLSARKLLPALYNLNAEGLLPAQGRIIGIAPLDGWNDARLREHARDSITRFSRSGINVRRFRDFAKRLRFVKGGVGGDIGAVRDVATLDRRLMYFAVPPSAFGPLIGGIGRAQLAQGTSLIIEKPFGHSLQSARALNQTIHAVLPEDQVYRIDHYLGKETVQNLLVFRFGNSLWERVWNHDAIKRVEITVAESLGMEGRGAFYEETGAIRDIVQNHMFQLLSVVAMDPPSSFDAESLRNEKVKVLRSVHDIELDAVVRGQYTTGAIAGKRVKGYTQEPGVSKQSTTETYAAMHLHIDSWRWARTPFLLRTGKRLKARETRIVLQLKGVPLQLFKDTPIDSVRNNRLVIRVQPDEGIALWFSAKEPGPELRTQPVRMDFSYGHSFKTSPPEAYERLLHDAMAGDHTLFIREDEVELGWSIVQPILDDPPPVVPYRAGSWGPREADAVAAPGTWDPLGAID